MFSLLLPSTKLVSCSCRFMHLRVMMQQSANNGFCVWFLLTLTLLFL